MVPRLIGISGKLQSGKDTLATQMQQILAHHYHLPVAIQTLADPLRRCVAALTGCQPQDLQQQAFKASPSPLANPAGGYYTYRQLLQWMGDSLRALNPQSVVDALWARLDPQSYYLIPDVRTLDEVAAIKRQGGIVIRVERPGLASLDSHPTEMALEVYGDFDGLIINDGTPADLEEQARLLLARLMNAPPLANSLGD